MARIYNYLQDSEDKKKKTQPQQTTPPSAPTIIPAPVQTEIQPVPAPAPAGRSLSDRLTTAAPKVATLPSPSPIRVVRPFDQPVYTNPDTRFGADLPSNYVEESTPTGVKATKILNPTLASFPPDPNYRFPYFPPASSSSPLFNVLMTRQRMQTPFSAAVQLPEALNLQDRLLMQTPQRNPTYPSVQKQSTELPFIARQALRVVEPYFAALRKRPLNDFDNLQAPSSATTAAPVGSVAGQTPAPAPPVTGRTPASASSAAGPAPALAPPVAGQTSATALSAPAPPVVMQPPVIDQILPGMPIQGRLPNVPLPAKTQSLIPRDLPMSDASVSPALDSTQREITNGLQVYRDVGGIPRIAQPTTPREITNAMQQYRDRLSQRENLTNRKLSPIQQARVNYIAEGARPTINRETGETEIKQNRGLKEILKSAGIGALGGLQAGGLGGAIAGALTGGIGHAVSPEAARRMRFEVLERPELERQRQQDIEELKLRRDIAMSEMQMTNLASQIGSREKTANAREDANRIRAAQLDHRMRNQEDRLARSTRTETDSQQRQKDLITMMKEAEKLKAKMAGYGSDMKDKAVGSPQYIQAAQEYQATIGLLQDLYSDLVDIEPDQNQGGSQTYRITIKRPQPAPARPEVVPGASDKKTTSTVSNVASRSAIQLQQFLQ